MSEEKKQETSAPVEAKEQPKEEIKAEQKLFTQEQLDNIIQARIMSERKKYEKKIDLLEHTRYFLTLTSDS